VWPASRYLGHTDVLLRANQNHVLGTCSFICQETLTRRQRRPFCLSSQVATCFYQSNHSNVSHPLNQS